LFLLFLSKFLTLFIFVLFSLLFFFFLFEEQALVRQRNIYMPIPTFPVLEFVAL